jgi:hypothetical protein
MQKGTAMPEGVGLLAPRVQRGGTIEAHCFANPCNDFQPPCIGASVHGSTPWGGSIIYYLLSLTIKHFSIMATISNAKLLARIEAKGVVTEGEINLIKNRMNRGKAGYEEEEKLIIINPNLTEEQTEKGLAWLLNLWKTPTGKIRKNNPFGDREQKALDSFLYFTFEGFYNAGNYYVDFFVPIWGVHGLHGSFEYYNDYKGIHIIG